MRESSHLLNKALEYTKFSYAPYSKFKVACILIASNGNEDKEFYGVNVENSSYGLTICAERVAIFKAISEEYKILKALYLVAVDSEGFEVLDIMPCGACRQVMIEFSDNLSIITRKSEYKIKELIPFSFRLKNHI
ncbi:MAG: cytidine deaminase [candidate division WOR-3 bacterium]|nr:cytidine deaminase [candidate division WOR-3 bacterium]MCX7948358.1 cytidine deaminase [candidate division WOR-3 bacterium]MDW8151259.1 cytidine deaminase [candidate division WOR-3 bacterium]